MGAEFAERRDILIYLTQDAVPLGADAFANLVRAFEDAEIGAAYGRQLPRERCQSDRSACAAFSYPATSPLCAHGPARRTTGLQVHLLLECIWSVPARGADECGRFFAGCDLWRRYAGGGAHASCRVEDRVRGRCDGAAFARVFRSPRNSGGTSTSECCTRARAGSIEQFGSASGEGRRFVVSELKHLMKHGPQHVPSAMMRTLAKYAGYKIGRGESRIAPGLKYRLGLNRQYWIR